MVRKLTGIALYVETREKLFKYKKENECKSYDETINFMFDLIESLFKDLEILSPIVSNERGPGK